jgi:DNA-binding PadR family transcriptional regulator
MYSLTKAGTAALADRRKVWGRFAYAVDTLLTGGRAWPA